MKLVFSFIKSQTLILKTYRNLLKKIEMLFQFYFDGLNFRLIEKSFEPIRDSTLDYKKHSLATKNSLFGWLTLNFSKAPWAPIYTYFEGGTRDEKTQCFNQAVQKRLKTPPAKKFSP